MYTTTTTTSTSTTTLPPDNVIRMEIEILSAPYTVDQSFSELTTGTYSYDLTIDWGDSTATVAISNGLGVDQHSHTF